VFAAGGAGARVATGAAIGTGVGVGGATGLAVADEREPPPTARGEDAAPGVPDVVSVHAAPDRAKTMQSDHTAADSRSFMPPGPSPRARSHIHGLWSIVHVQQKAKPVPCIPDPTAPPTCCRSLRCQTLVLHLLQSHWTERKLSPR
jgi:hypothetical protein